MVILQTQRFSLREITQDDFAALCKVFKDPKAMYAYVRAFTDEEVQEWLDAQFKSYAQEGFGMWAIVPEGSQQPIGQCGLHRLSYDGRDVIEISYQLQKAFWHNGYATQAVAACKDYALNTLGAQEVFCFIREDNLPSLRVAQRNGMWEVGDIVRHYRGLDLAHKVYSLKKGSAGAEYCDIYGEDGSPLGIVRERHQPLGSGEFKRAVGVWVFNSDRQILLTQRDLSKGFAPGLWENTGGHVMAGEDMRASALRELFEETGIIATADALKFIGTAKVAPYFGDNFVLRRDIKAEDIVLRAGETAAAQWVSYERFSQMGEQGELAPSVMAHLTPLLQAFKAALFENQA